MAFKEGLIAFAQTKNGHVVNTIKTMVDVPPPAHPGIRAPPDMLASHKDDEATFRDLCTKRIAVCSTLYRSLEVDIISAQGDDREQPHVCNKVFLVKFGDLTQLVRGQGPDNVLALLGEIGSYTMQQHHQTSCDA
jgi:hypothetical protein